MATTRQIFEELSDPETQLLEETFDLVCAGTLHTNTYYNYSDPNRN